MTDQQPDETTLRIGLNDDELRDAFDRATTSLRQLAFRITAGAALGAYLADDEQHARRVLAGLNAEQLERVENAAVALSLTAARMRGDAEDATEGEAWQRAHVLRAVRAEATATALGKARDEQRQRAEQAEADARGLLQALEAERHTYATWQQRAETAERERDEQREIRQRLGEHQNALRRALDLSADCPWVDIIIAARRWRERAEQAERERAEATADPDIRAFLDRHPDAFATFLRREIRRDPEWFRRYLRKELRLGWLADDFRRAGLDEQAG
ncbi:hypothetical protein [Actinomadura miaoliensis]